MKYLITFGCSWTWGAGAGYSNGMSADEFKNIVFDKNLADKYSFRNLIAEEYGYKNINFSIWKSSNRKQFRTARNFFSSDIFEKIRKSEDIIVLWGLTSTSRNEWYSSKNNEYKNFLLAGGKMHDSIEKELSDFMLNNVYDHEHEIFELAKEMSHWNSYFNAMGVKNYWFDSFNHHDYTQHSPGLSKNNLPIWNIIEYTNDTNIKNFVVTHENARDLLSQLAINNGIGEFDTNYHNSVWTNDTNRLNFLVEKSIINPFSFHPTAKGHQQIKEMFDYIFTK
jgi:hypothetical protein